MTSLVRKLPPSLIKPNPDLSGKWICVPAAGLATAAQRGKGPDQTSVLQRLLCLEHGEWGRRARLLKGDPVCFVPAPGLSLAHVGTQSMKEGGGESGERVRIHKGQVFRAGGSVLWSLCRNRMDLHPRFGLGVETNDATPTKRL